MRECNKASEDLGQKCSTCISYKFQPHNDWNGWCHKNKFRVKKDELCDKWGNVPIADHFNKISPDNLNDIKTYVRSTKGRGEPTKGWVSETSFIPNPSPKDYKKGYILRKFVQRRHNTNEPIKEVGDFSGFSKKYFHQLKLRWKIKGPPYNDITSRSGQVIEKSAYNFNKDSVRYASTELPQIKYKISNYLFLVEKKKK